MYSNETPLFPLCSKRENIPSIVEQGFPAAAAQLVDPPAIAVAVRAWAGGAWEPGSAGGAAFSHHLVCSDLEKFGKYCFGRAPMCTF